jgi:hypothetical protein
MLDIYTHTLTLKEEKLDSWEYCGNPGNTI